MKTRRNSRRSFRGFQRDAFMAQPAQLRSSAEIERVTKILADLEESASKPERTGGK